MRRLLTFVAIIFALPVFSQVNSAYTGTKYVNIVKDRNAPEITISSPEDGFTTTASSVTVSGQATDNAGISQIRVNGTIVGHTAGRFSTTVPLTLGANTITVEATDVNGNSATKTITVTRQQPPPTDNTCPQIAITYPPVEQARGFTLVVQEQTVEIQGTATDPSGVSYVMVNNVLASLDGDSFTATIQLQEGDNQITIKAADKLGNSCTKQFTLKYTTGNQVAGNSLVQGKFYALIIAVQDYQDPAINDLQYPIQQAQQLRDVLVNYYTFDPQNVIFLKNPTRDQIISQLDILTQKLTEDDNLLIYYAGHGIWRDDRNQGYWLPADAQLSITTRWIRNSTLAEYFAGIKARNILLISDACFSGSIFLARSLTQAQQQAAEQLYQEKSRVAMTSGYLKEVPDRSVFTEYLIKRLRDNTDKYLPASDLYLRLREPVMVNDPSHNTPQYGVVSQSQHEGGDFVFVRR